MLCMYPKIIRVCIVSSFKVTCSASDTILALKKVGDIFPAFPFRSEGRFKNINQKLDCRIAGNPTSDFITKTSFFLMLPLTSPTLLSNDIDYFLRVRSAENARLEIFYAS